MIYKLLNGVTLNWPSHMLNTCTHIGISLLCLICWSHFHYYNKVLKANKFYKERKLAYLTVVHAGIREQWSPEYWPRVKVSQQKGSNSSRRDSISKQDARVREGHCHAYSISNSSPIGIESIDLVIFQRQDSQKVPLTKSLTTSHVTTLRTNVWEYYSNYVKV